MKTVDVSKSILLEKVKYNREKHIQEYDEAVVGYKEKLAELVEDAITKVKAELDKAIASKVAVSVSWPGLRLVVPESHEADYNRVISMLEMSVQDTIELSADEFSSYVMDNWGWKQTFENTKLSYSKSFGC